MLERSAESCLAFGQGPPCLDLLCSELGEKNRAPYLAVVLPPGCHGPAHPIGTAALAGEEVLLLGEFLASEHAHVHVTPAVRNVGKRLVVRAAYERQIRGKLEVGHEAPRDRQVPHVTIEHGNGGRGVLDE